MEFASFRTKCYLDDSGGSRSHQSISKDGMNHSAEREVLRVSRHSPTSNEDDETRNKVPLWSSISLSAQPHTGQARTPTYNAHGCVLDVVCDPRSSPSVFSKGVDTTPRSNECRVEELLRSSSSLQPGLSDKHDDSQKDAVANESASHNEMGKTLTKVVISTISKRSDSTKQHLYPGDDRHGLANNSVAMNCDLSDLPMESLCDMEFQVYSEDDLYDEHDHQDVREGGVDILRKCSSLMKMPQEVCHHCNSCS